MFKVGEVLEEFKTGKDLSSKFQIYLTFCIYSFILMASISVK